MPLPIQNVAGLLRFPGESAGGVIIGAQNIGGQLIILLPNTNPTVGQVLTVESVSGTSVVTGWTTNSGLNPTLITVIYSSTPVFDFSQGLAQQITLAGDATSTFINAVVGSEYTIIIRQNSTGGYTFNWPSSYKGSLPAGTTASTASVFKLFYDGTNYYLVGAPIEGQ